MNLILQRGIAICWMLLTLSIQLHSQDKILDVLKKDQLKVLDIGNSYTDDATSMLSQLVKANGTDVNDMCLYKAVISAGSFKDWYNVYHDQCNKKVSVNKVLGGIKANIATGQGNANDGALFRAALEKEKWDLIVIHQYSYYAPYYEQWQGEGAGGYLDKLLDIIKEHQPDAKLGMLLTHSYWDNYASNREKSSLLRWELIAESVEKCCDDYPIDLVIPYGTALEDIRSSSLNNEVDLTLDGIHCGIGLGRYTASCCYYEALLAPRIGKSILGNALRYTAGKTSSAYPPVSVTDENALLAQIAAVLAVRAPYTCINPEDSLYTIIHNADGSLDLAMNKYQLICIADGDTLSCDSITLGTSIKAIAAPEREGYAFSGWSEHPNEMPSHNVVVEGHFTKIPVTLAGDANNDDQVSVADVMAVVERIFGLPPAGFHFTNADMNEDEGLNVADVMAIVGIITNKEAVAD